MKRILLVLLVAITVCEVVTAQTKQGTINYERKINLWKRIRDEQRRANVPEFRSTKHVLTFNDTVSLYKTIKEEDEINPFEGGGEGRGFGGGGGRGRMFGSNDGDLFKNFSTGMSIQATEQSGKDFLISDTIKNQPWKITGETKTILGFNCHKATLKQKGGFGGGGFGDNGGNRRNRELPPDMQAPPATDTTKRVPQEIEVVAWFADKILAPVGPDNYGQLPGAILEVNIDNGFMVFTATEIKDLKSPKDLKEPKKGKPVTRAEFRKMMMDLRQHFGNAVPEPSN